MEVQKLKKLLAFSTQLVDNNIRPCYDSKGAFVRRFLSISRADWYIGLKTILKRLVAISQHLFFCW
ncbi:hypothetical protein [Carnobacterium alterfunditum]|uniref:hypothetical protein n=1 Tax=Carnobacterium alterfunditum TaxID=28230 RepID=UPI0035932E19